MDKTIDYLTFNDYFSGLKTYHIGVIESASHRALRKHKDELLKEYSLTGMQWYIIGTVADAGSTGARITDLAKTLDVSLAFLTTAINLLESKKILARKANKEDSRSTFVIMKKGYLKTYTKIEQDLREKLKNSIYSMVSPEELKTYIGVIKKFAELN